MSRYQDLKDIPFCEKHLPCEACTYRENKLREWYEAQLTKAKQERDEWKPLVAAVKKYNVDTPQQLDALMKKRRERAEQAEADLSEALEELDRATAILCETRKHTGRRPCEFCRMQTGAARLRERRGR